MARSQARLTVQEALKRPGDVVDSIEIFAQIVSGDGV